MRPSLNIGIEEEYQTIDPSQPRPAVAYQRRDHRQGQGCQLNERVKPEMHVSRWSRSAPASAATSRRPQATFSRSAAASSSLHARMGLRLAAAGTHPFADWRAQEIYPDERYATIVEELQDGGAREPHLRPSRAHRHRGSARPRFRS